MFRRQYGDPFNASGRMFTYSYDNYTTIVLDCRRGCVCRCTSK